MKRQYWVICLISLALNGCAYQLVIDELPVNANTASVDTKPWENIYADDVYVAVRSAIRPIDPSRDLVDPASKAAFAERKFRDLCDRDLLSKFASVESTYLIAARMKDGEINIPVFSVSSGDDCTMDTQGKYVLPLVRLPREISIARRTLVNKETKLNVSSMADIAGVATSFFTSGGAIVMTTLTKIATDDRVKKLNKVLNDEFTEKTDIVGDLIRITPDRIKRGNMSEEFLIQARDESSKNLYPVAKLVLTIEVTKSYLTDRQRADFVPDYGGDNYFVKSYAIGSKDAKPIEEIVRSTYQGNMTRDFGKLRYEAVSTDDYIEICRTLSKALEDVGLTNFDKARLKHDLLSRTGVWTERNNEAFSGASKCFDESELRHMRLLGLEPIPEKPVTLPSPART